MAVSGVGLQNYYSIYDDIWMSAISSASGQTDLKYVLEFYKEQNAEKIFEAKILPEPSTKYMYFNSAPIFRNVFSEKFFDIDKNPEAFKFDNITITTNNQDKAGLFYRIGEDYSGITNLNQTSGFVYCSFLRPKLKNRFWKYTTNYREADINHKWQTDRRLVASLSKNTDKFYVGFRSSWINPDYLIAPVLGFTSYDSAGNILNTDEAQILPGGNNNYILNIGPNAVESITGTNPDIETCAYYIVYVKYTYSNSEEYTLTFRINKHCENKFESIPIHFYNRFHSIDTMRFDFVSRTTVDVERKSYNKRDYYIEALDYLFPRYTEYAGGNNIYRENKINYNATYNYTMKLTSDLLDDQDWEWLEDLILSPKIYMEEDDYFYPVTIKATNYEISKYINNRLRPLEIEIEFNSPRLSSIR